MWRLEEQRLYTGWKDESYVTGAKTKDAECHAISAMRLGGLVRGLVGVLIAAMFVENDVRFAILAGYVGGDFIESLYKVRFREKYHPSNRKVRIP